MALRFVDSFDHYVAADMMKKWTSLTNGIIEAGRNGNCIRLSNASGAEATKTLDAQATWYVGFGFLTTDIAALKFLRFMDGTVTHVQLQLNASGNLLIYRGDATTLLGTGSSALSVNTWYHIQCKVVISDTVGEVAIKINGTDETITWVTGTGTTQDTRNAGNASVDRISLLGNNNEQHKFDDLWVCDSTGSSPTNTYLGDCKVEVLRPSGAGNSAQFTPLDDTNYENVDDATADGDTTYNASATSGHIDSFAMGNLAMTSGTIYGVQTNVWARKDDAGSVSLQPHFRISSTNYARTSVSLADTYLDYLAIEETNPNTAAAWDVAGVNGAEFGYKMP